MKHSTENKIKIIIADDHAIVRKGLIQVISETSDLEVVGEANNGDELLGKIEELDVDVVLLDIGMPERSGWDAMILLKRMYPSLPVIVLTIYPEEDFAVNFLKAGAAGYLTKSSAPEQLVGAVRKVARGGKFVSPALAEKLAIGLVKGNDKPPHEALSPREFQIFLMIASGKTVKEIAEELSLSIPTISTNRTRILEKLRLKNSAQLTHYAFKKRLVD